MQQQNNIYFHIIESKYGNQYAHIHVLDVTENEVTYERYIHHENKEVTFSLETVERDLFEQLIAQPLVFKITI